jgi:hypothetical protein
MSASKQLTILDRELKIKFYPCNDLLEVPSISQARGQGISAIIQNISGEHKEKILEEALNHALVNEAKIVMKNCFY